MESVEGQAVLAKARAAFFRVIGKDVLYGSYDKYDSYDRKAPGGRAQVSICGKV